MRAGDIVRINDGKDRVLRKGAREFALHIRQQELPGVAGVARSDHDARDECDRGQPPFSYGLGYEPLRVRLRLFIGPEGLPDRAILPHDDAGRHPDPGHAAREEEPRDGGPQRLVDHVAGPLDVHANVVAGIPNPRVHEGREMEHRIGLVHLISEGRGVRDVSHDRIQVFMFRKSAPLRTEHECVHVPSVVEELSHEVASDEARTPGHERTQRHARTSAPPDNNVSAEGSRGSREPLRCVRDFRSSDAVRAPRRRIRKD